MHTTKHPLFVAVITHKDSQVVTQNSYVERFNRTYRGEILNMYVFRNLTEVRQRTEFWMTEYNDERPHDSLEDLTLLKYLAKYQQAENSNQRCN